MLQELSDEDNGDDEDDLIMGWHPADDANPVQVEPAAAGRHRRVTWSEQLVRAADPVQDDLDEVEEDDYTRKIRDQQAAEHSCPSASSSRLKTRKDVEKKSGNEFPHEVGKAARQWLREEKIPKGQGGSRSRVRVRDELESDADEGDARRRSSRLSKRQKK